MMTRSCDGRLRYWLHLLQAPKYGAGFIAAIDRLYEAPWLRDCLSVAPGHDGPLTSFTPRHGRPLVHVRRCRDDEPLRLRYAGHTLRAHAHDR